MEALLAYLKRNPCINCKINDTGILVHCSSCAGLYEGALAEVKVLMTPLTEAQKEVIEKEKLVRIQEMKESHSWVSVQSYVDVVKSRMMPFCSHCGACGLAMAQFKIEPKPCTKQK